MQRGFRIELGSAAKSAERERSQAPAAAFRIGSAAKSAEQAARESGTEPLGQASVGIRVSSTLGHKFELPDQLVPPPEQIPAAQAAVVQQPATAPAAVEQPAAPPLSRLWVRFRGLFNRNL
jgi:hypothetical protein